MSVTIGIDPDSNGAVATIDGDGYVIIESLQFVASGEVDLAALRLRLEWHRKSDAIQLGVQPDAYVERQRLVFIPSQRPGARPQIAIKASVTLAKIEYAIRGLLAGMNIPMESIPPGSWKKAFVHGKEAMLPVASRKFPSVKWSGNKLKKEGQATALMLAEWGRRDREGRPE